MAEKFPLTTAAVPEGCGRFPESVLVLPLKNERGARRGAVDSYVMHLRRSGRALGIVGTHTKDVLSSGGTGRRRSRGTCGRNVRVVGSYDRSPVAGSNSSELLFGVVVTGGVEVGRGGRGTDPRDVDLSAEVGVAGPCAGEI